MTNRYDTARKANIQKLKDRGLEILSDWNGQLGIGKASTHVHVTVRNTLCGHTFTSLAKNLITRGVMCPACARTLKTNNINHWSERNSDRWRQTAPEWKVYRSIVQSLTRLTYKKHKDTINPNNLPFGRAGTEGAYHLDHIVPVRWCFERDVPHHIVADLSNLQMLPWLENIAQRDHLKEAEIPEIFKPYVD